jgi:4-amino-4-deoxy-L-arabinose transferase-like glycosyltransferase
MIDFIQRQWYWVSLLSLVIVAAALRFYLLGTVPHGMTWDEAAIGYNGFAIWEAHRDEWVRFMPISFQSFGDYKAPLAIYLNGFFTFAFGMNLFAVRLPFALAAVGAILGMAWMSWLLAKTTRFANPELFSIAAATLLSFSPWHIHYSRAGFESGMATSFLIWGVSFLLLFIYTQQDSFVTFGKHWFGKVLHLDYLNLFLASGFFVASMYTYHSSKIVVPAIGLLITTMFWEVWRKNLTKLLFVAVLCAVLLTPMAWDSIKGPGATRLTQTSIFTSEASAMAKATLLVQNFLAHFSPRFLVEGQTTTLRHGAGQWGVLLPTTMAFVVVGSMAVVVQLVITKKQGHVSTFYRPLLFFSLSWIVLGILPAALGADDVPHSNRALLALPGFLLLASCGWFILVDKVAKSKLNKSVLGNHGERNTVRNAVVGTTILLHGIFFLSFWRYYLTSFAAASSSAFQDGYLEAMKLAQEYERGLNGKPEVDKIMFSSEYGQPYIYALFTRQTSPEFYQGGSLIKYEFTDVSIGDFERANTLVVGTAGDTDLPQAKADHLVYGSDGKVRFHLYYRP